MSTNDKRPEADSLSAAAKDLADKTKEAGNYAYGRVTASASGDKNVDKDIKETTKENATDAKEHGKGIVASIQDTVSSIGDSLSGKGSETKASAKSTAEDAKDGSKSALSKTEDKAKETYNKAGDKAEETKKDVKASYHENVTKQLETDPFEEDKAHGLIPADTETLKAASAKK